MAEDFANNSFYSNRYAHADSRGVKRMFLCRVAVGEFCLGKNGQLTPDVRDDKRNLLYDSTTDNMDSSKRDVSWTVSLFVVVLLYSPLTLLIIPSLDRCMSCTMTLRRIQTTSSSTP